MARGGGILVGFEGGGFDPTGIAEEGLNRNTVFRQAGEQVAFNREQSGERQSWERQMQPLRMQRAVSEQQEREQRIAETDRKVKKETRASQRMQALADRIGTDKPPTAEEIFRESIIANAEMGNLYAATGAASDFMRMRERDDERDDIAGMATESFPLLTKAARDGWDMEAADQISAIVSKYPRAAKTEGYRKLQDAAIKGYEKVLPAAAAEATADWRLRQWSGEDPEKAWYAVLSSRPEANAYFSRKDSKIPADIATVLKESAVTRRQETRIKTQQAEDTKKRLAVEEARSRNAAELQRMRDQARTEDIKLREGLRAAGKGAGTGGAEKLLKAQISTAQSQIKALTKQLGDTREEDDRNAIQAKITFHEGRIQSFSDRLDDLAKQPGAGGEAAPPAARPPAEAPPKAGGEAKTPTEAVTIDRAKRDIGNHLSSLAGRGGEGFDYKGELRKNIQRYVDKGALTNEQAKSLFYDLLKNAPEPKKK